MCSYKVAQLHSIKYAAIGGAMYRMRREVHVIVACFPWHLPCVANGCLPERQLFEQNKMRTHLYNCLKKGEQNMFPIAKQRVPRKVVKSNDTIPIMCQKTTE